MPQTGRSGCPINLTLEQLGDRWSLIVVRDVIFGNRRSYGELLAQSEEVDAKEVHIMASKSVLLRALVAGSSAKTAGFGVPSSVPKWRPLGESNPSFKIENLAS